MRFSAFKTAVGMNVLNSHLCSSHLADLHVAFSITGIKVYAVILDVFGFSSGEREWRCHFSGPSYWYVWLQSAGDLVARTTEDRRP